MLQGLARAFDAAVDAGPTSSRKHCALLAALTVLLWLPRLQGPIDLRWDAGVYYVLGEALAEGKGYRLLNEPGEIAAVQYPPLLPAAVALHQMVLGTSDPVVVGHALRLTYLALTLLYTLAVYRMARGLLAPVPALFTSLVTAFYVQTYFLSDLLFAEIPFALATVLLVLALRGGTMRGQIAAAVLAVAAALLRTIGVALLAAWVGESVVKRRWREGALRAAVAVLPLVAWQHYVAVVRAGPEYREPAYPYQRAAYQYYNVTYAENVALVDPFRPEEGGLSGAALASRVVTNVGRMAVRLGEAVSVVRPFWEFWVKRLDRVLGKIGLPLWPAALPSAILSVFIGWGLVLLAIRGQWLMALYVAASLGLVCLTPWPGQLPRYLAPLTPFLAICLAESLLRARSRWGVWGTRLAGAVAAAVLASQVYAAASSYVFEHPRAVWGANSERPMAAHFFFYDQHWRSFDASLDWLLARGRKGEVVATAAPHFVFLRTGLLAVMPPMEADPARAQALLDSVPVTWLIVDAIEFPDMARRYAEPAVRTRPDLWDEVYASTKDGLRIYRRKG
jgi:hypothetical protein